MTNPPPPGNWGPPQPGPQPPYGQGQPPYGPPPGQWPAQQGWGQPQPPKNNGLKSLLIGVAVLLVIAITVGATLLFTRDDGGDPPTANGSSSAAGDIASADDTGPVSIITEDPTCAPWRPIATTLSNKQKQGWERRNYSTPATAWSPEERAMHDSIAAAVRDAADQTVELAKMTPHRVMRELYEQSIAYWRAYADSIPTYTEADNSLIGVASDASSAVVSICAAIENDAAAARAPLVPVESQTLGHASEGSPNNPLPFIGKIGDPSCASWIAASNALDVDAAPWRDNDPNIPASEWSPELKSTMESMVPVMSDFADELTRLGSTTDNSTLRDFAALSAQYWRAFALALPTYQVSDNSLASVAAYTHYLVFNACESTEE